MMADENSRDISALRTPQLRGHHLICLQFVHGGGHTAEFARNVLRTIGRLTEEEGTIAAGADDLCEACTYLVDGVCTNEGEGQGEEAVRVLDALALQLLGLKPGDTFDYGTTSASVTRVLDRWRELACAGCPSEDSCAPLIDLTCRFQPHE